MATRRQISAMIAKPQPRWVIYQAQPRRSITSVNSSNGSKNKKEENVLHEKTERNSPPHKKTQSELDKELELKMKGIAGDGGESGIEYEDGQPVAMKRSVRNNMFRYI